jgi:hypothetical protein
MESYRSIEASISRTIHTFEIGDRFSHRIVSTLAAAMTESGALMAMIVAHRREKVSGDRESSR